NLTGGTTVGGQAGPKKTEMHRGVIPAATAVGLPFNPSQPTLVETPSKDLPAAAPNLNLHFNILGSGPQREFVTAVRSLVRFRGGGLVIGADTFFNSRSELLAALATRHAIPTISPYRDFAAAGGLMSYGGGVVAASREAGVYAGRILKGERPADLPVQQSI